MKIPEHCMDCIGRNVCVVKIDHGSAMCVNFHNALESKLHSHNTHIKKFPDLEEFQQNVKEWHDSLSYMPSLDFITAHIYSDYIRKHLNV